MIFSFEMPLPAKIWSTNDDRRLHHAIRAGLVKDWKIATRYHYQVNFGRTRQKPSIVQVHIPIPDNRRRDPHNYCGTVMKAMIDGMVMADAWPDDTPEYVGHREPILYRGEVVKMTWTLM